MTASYCGCCGDQIGPGLDWCTPCLRHLRPPLAPAAVGCTMDHPWERTYEAQHGTPCPYNRQTVLDEEYAAELGAAYHEAAFGLGADYSSPR